ncbi:MAG TPA: hypothetical protein PLM14_09270 [Candidatus Hydrogenedentes bacterium]|nr:hypothetical protein [Candidatus Hydrogenedentota bacterium]HQH54393.1 hypothetical protein [Candidatus Hydrogenedentota bacterium]
MKQLSARWTLCSGVALSIAMLLSCNEGERGDAAVQLQVPVTGSLQNPAWSPDATQLVFTRFIGGYNAEPADLMVVDAGTLAVRVLVSDGSANVNLPGLCWNGFTNQVVFSSSREPHDEVYAIDADGSPGDEEQVTDRPAHMAYEPSFSPDGESVVFESHLLDVEDNGVIMRYDLDGSDDYVALTAPEDDSRQPNWSPRGDRIVYQRLENGQWDLWVMNPDGSDGEQITTGSGDKTDASFSSDGEWIVYSSDEGGLEFANLFVVPLSGGAGTRVTYSKGYDGAPSWSPDGGRIAFESYPGDPDDSPGTALWTIQAPSR